MTKAIITEKSTSEPGIALSLFQNRTQGYVVCFSWMFGDGDAYEDTEFPLSSVKEVRPIVAAVKVFIDDVAAAAKDWKNRMDDYRDYDKIYKQPGFIALFGEVDQDDVSEYIPSDQNGILPSLHAMTIEFRDGGLVYEVIVDGKKMW